MPYPDEEWQLNYMRELEAQIVEWKDLYYNHQPAVDDSTFDLWWRNLLFLEDKYPHLKNENSVIDSVGAPLMESPAGVVESIEKRDEEYANFYEIDPEGS